MLEKLFGNVEQTISEYAVIKFILQVTLTTIRINVKGSKTITMILIVCKKLTTKFVSVR